MLHNKYEGSMPCSFRQDFFYLFTRNVWPLLASSNNLNKLDRDSLGDDATYEISML